MTTMRNIKLTIKPPKQRLRFVGQLRNGHGYHQNKRQPNRATVRLNIKRGLYN